MSQRMERDAPNYDNRSEQVRPENDAEVRHFLEVVAAVVARLVASQKPKVYTKQQEHEKYRYKGK